ncbi:hypothetical protein Spb1_10100 [Planctopirus ephydatiae]|uniref:Thioredoxin domain-containing protein n=1 Tax=Planctopirus ephydatiae TaxID=2528019 RepID=A0A518GL24_9PLAN|nr:hypothetical protein Spb1_10100 [Planctopirus ephydatiae]
MTGNADGLQTLEKYSRIPVSSIRYVADADADIVRSIHDGVLFLVAFWSGPSLGAFSKLTKAMHDMGLRDLELVVVDVDGSPGVYQLPEIKELFGGVVNAPPGWGEAAFCRDGQIVAAAVVGRGFDSNEYYFISRKLLSSFDGE